MTFSFDTGDQRRNPAADGLSDAWIDAVMDKAGGPEAPRHKFLRAAASQIINDIWEHKSTDGVRRMFWKRDAILNEMATSEPSAHDDVVENLFERLTLLKETPAKAGVGAAPAKAEKPLNMRKPEMEKTHNGF